MTYNIKFVSSDYDEESGQSTVICAYKDMAFIGTSILLDEDRSVASKYTGCRIAEKKARIKAMKYIYQKKKAECETCRNFVKSLEGYRNFKKDSGSVEVSLVYRQLRRRINEVNKIAEAITKMEWELNVAISMQDLVAKRIKAKND